MKILLVEPKSSTTYPPLGLMKIGRYHKLKGDDVHYVVGMDKKAYSDFWDKIYITSVFTYDYKHLEKTIEFYSGNLFNFGNMIVGGVAATLLKNKIEHKTGVAVHSGLLDDHDEFLASVASSDKDYAYLLDSTPSIDNLPPDYSILPQKSGYEKVVDNSFFFYTTKGCPNNCGFCAVKQLEPKYVDYIPIKPRIDLMRKEVGDRAGLLLLDNNIAASKTYFRIIDEIIDCGYGKGEKMCYERNGRNIYKNRFVDFNQGVDLRLMDKKKMEYMAKIAIKPLRLAFDNMSISDDYIDKMEMAIDCGIDNLSNYMLFNYKDSPDDLYERIEINTEILKRSSNNKVKIFSFPMRYSPIGKIHRKYIGKKWTRRKIRAVQLILNATHGIVSHSLSKGEDYKEDNGYFYRAFGSNIDEYRKLLMYPFGYIINRDLHEKHTKLIPTWNQLYSELSDSDKEILEQRIANGRVEDFTKTQSTSLNSILKLYKNEDTTVIQKEDWDRCKREAQEAGLYP